jgi:hypothetical protein
LEDGFETMFRGVENLVEVGIASYEREKKVWQMFNSQEFNMFYL